MLSSLLLPLLLTLLLVIVVLAALIFVSLRVDEHHAYMYLGGGSRRTRRPPQYYYHGSPVDIPDGEPLRPRPSNVLDGESAVFATNNLSTALMFLGEWDDADISYGTYDSGQRFALELRPGAFSALKAPGYIFYVDPKYFTADERLGLSGEEFISRGEVPVVKKEYVADALKRMKDLGEIKFVTFHEMMKLILG